MPRQALTPAFAFLSAGWVLLVSGQRNQSVADTLRGTIGSAIGPGERGFTAAILEGLGGAPSAGAAGGPLPSGMRQVDGKPVCAWIAEELEAAKQAGWSGSVVSGYRSVAEQAAACAGTSGPCAPPGQSNHQGTAWPKCAVDVSDPEGLARALPRGSRLKWTGRTIGDSPHFSSGRRGV